MAAISALTQHHSPSHLSTSIAIAIPVMDTTTRPASALARGVRITEYTDSRVNPDPIVLEESELLLEEYLSPRKLRDLTGVDNLEEVHYLEMRVDTRDTSLGNFGSHLPNLSQLKLSNSIIMSVRDVGSCLSNLRVLWMARCGVEDLDGLSSITNLRELYLAYNEIADISPCSMLEHLQILDLEGNNIEDLPQVEFLALCRSLTNLTLEGNPVCLTPDPKETSLEYNYRLAVKKCVPHLKILDDEPLVDSTESASMKSTDISVFDLDWKLIDEMMQDGTINVSDDETIEPPNRPVTAAMRPPTSYRPGSALKPYTNANIRPLSSRPSRRPVTRANQRVPTAAGRPGSSGSGGSRPGTGSRLRGDEEDDMQEPDGASDLTKGVVFCGNPCKALKSRNKSPADNQSTKKAKLLSEKLKHKPEHSYDLALEEDEKFTEILSELKEWKHHHKQVVDDIQASKAPQVLLIDHNHDDAISVSDDDDDESISSDEDYTPHPPPSSAASSASLYSKKSGLDHFRPASGGARPKSSSSSRYSARSSRSKDSLDDNLSMSSSHSNSPHLTPPHTPSHPASQPHKSHSLDNVRSPSPLGLKHLDDSRPYSGPDMAPVGRYKLSQIIDKSDINKNIDTSNPVIRASIHSPEGPKVLEGPRAGTSRAALGGHAVSSTKIRKGNLANVQLLPSKFTK